MISCKANPGVRTVKRFIKIRRSLSYGSYESVSITFLKSPVESVPRTFGNSELATMLAITRLTIL